MRACRLRAVAALLLGVLAAGGLGAQLRPGDIVLTCRDTATAGGRTLCLDPVSGAVTTLLDKFPAPATQLLGSWVEMGPGNRDVWVAHEDGTSGALYVLSPAGAVVTVHPLAWRPDCFRLGDDGGITWSGYGGVFTNRLMRTDRSFGRLTTLVSGLPSLSLSHQEIEETGNLVAAFQSTSPLGGVAELDPRRGVVVKSLAGLGLVNTVDYHRTSGKVYAVEFGAPGQPSALAGSLFEVDLAAASVTTLIDARTPPGEAVDRLNWITCTRDGQLLLGARHRIHRYDPVARGIVKTWAYEADRLQALTGAVVYGSRPLALDTSGGTRPGGSVEVTLGFPHTRAAGAAYYLAAALALRPGIRLGTEVLDLAFDPVFFVSANSLAPGIFRNFQGFLGAQGQAAASIRIPALPSLEGQRLFVGAIAMIDGAVVVANVEGFTIRS
ncbi:MAG: hypothetical protein JXQ29_14215 [Planctomycetes bacterium]|nr:hypothetical protein [Planctomycetota bacterium]